MQKTVILVALLATAFASTTMKNKLAQSNANTLA